MIIYSDRVHNALMWMVGGLSARSWPHVGMLWPYTLVGFVLAVIAARHLNILQLGDAMARSLGMRVELTRLALTAVAAILAASAVAVVGLLGFVGLIVPHVARLLVGSDHRVLLPAAALLGAATLLYSDTFARVAFAPVELPVGIIMAALGAPFFLFLLREAIMTTILSADHLSYRVGHATIIRGPLARHRGGPPHGHHRAERRRQVDAAAPARGTCTA